MSLCEELQEGLGKVMEGFLEAGALVLAVQIEPEFQKPLDGEPEMLDVYVQDVPLRLLAYLSCHNGNPLSHMWGRIGCSRTMWLEKLLPPSLMGHSSQALMS